MANNINARREELGISIADLCKEVKICRKSYYNYSTGRREIPSDVLIKFSAALKCSADFLLGIQDYTCATVTDCAGEVVVSIGHSEIIERDGFKVILA